MQLQEAGETCWEGTSCPYFHLVRKGNLRKKFLRESQPAKTYGQSEGSWGVEGREKAVMGREEDTYWDEHRVLYVRQFDNTLKT